MSFEVEKNKKETSQSLVRRFTKRMRQSGLLMRARKLRFKKRPISVQAQKKAALRKEDLKKKYKKLEKLGELNNKSNQR